MIALVIKIRQLEINEKFYIIKPYYKREKKVPMNLDSTNLVKSSYVQTEYKSTGNHKHFHDDYSIVYVLDGIHKFENESARFEIEKDVIRLLNPNEFHKTLDTKWTYINFMVPSKYVENLAKKIFDDDMTNIKFAPVVKDEKANQFFFKLNKELKTVYPEQENVDKALENFISYLLKNFIYQNKNSLKIKRDSVLIKRMKKYILDNYTEKITLEDLEEIFSVDKFQINREFKRHLGVTPMKYILMVKINKAKKMIHDKVPLSEVAVTCGFSDQSNMIKNFKKIYNYTPSLVKNNVKEFTL